MEYQFASYSENFKVTYGFTMGLWKDILGIISTLKHPSELLKLDPATPRNYAWLFNT